MTTDALPPLRDPSAAQAYRIAAHARADALEQAVPPDMRTFHALLERRIALDPDSPLIRMGDTAISARDLRQQAAGLGGTLQAMGVSRGDKVALLCGNRPEFLPLVAAIAWIGATAVPINTASRGGQLGHILANSGASLLIIESALTEALATIDAPTPLRIVTLEDMPPPAAPVPHADPRPSDPLAILYTSGTTGPSKGVICPHAQFFWWAITTGRQLGIDHGDVLHTTLPLFHTNALNTFFQALTFGATLSLSARFSVSGFFSALVQSGATVTYLLGAMVPMLLSRPETADERDHHTRIALAPGVPAQYHAEFTRRTGILLLDAFGSTETNNVIQSETDSAEPGFMGRIAKGFSAIVADEQDNPLPPGVAGELLLRADHPFAFASGYLGMPEATVSTWRNQWVHTGDRVIQDAEGRFRFVDRMKEAIRRRGENISSYEVEQGLLSHPGIAVVAAFPVQSELAEDEVMVAVVAKEGVTLDPVDLIRHCEKQMPYFAVPRYIDIRTDLPRTENGKVQKFRLRDEGLTPTTWDRDAAGVIVTR